MIIKIIIMITMMEDWPRDRSHFLGSIPSIPDIEQTMMTMFMMTVMTVMMMFMMTIVTMMTMMMLTKIIVTLIIMTIIIMMTIFKMTIMMMMTLVMMTLSCLKTIRPNGGESVDRYPEFKQKVSPFKITLFFKILSKTANPTHPGLGLGLPGKFIFFLSKKDITNMLIYCSQLQIRFLCPTNPFQSLMINSSNNKYKELILHIIQMLGLRCYDKKTQRYVCG